MNSQDPEAQERVDTLNGVYGPDMQFAAVQARTEELINQHFGEYWMIGGEGAAVLQGNQPLILSRD